MTERDTPVGTEHDVPEPVHVLHGQRTVESVQFEEALPVLSRDPRILDLRAGVSGREA